MKKGRQQKRLDPSVTQEMLYEYPDKSNPFENVFEYSDVITLLNSIVGLSQEDQLLLYLRYIKQLDYREMAIQLHMKENTVRSAVFKAKKHALSLIKKMTDIANTEKATKKGKNP